MIFGVAVGGKLCLTLFRVECLRVPGGDPPLCLALVSARKRARGGPAEGPHSAAQSRPAAPGRASTGPSVCGPGALVGPPP